VREAKSSVEAGRDDCKGRQSCLVEAAWTGMAHSIVDLRRLLDPCL
jgi:hypothetical protein